MSTFEGKILSANFDLFVAFQDPRPVLTGMFALDVGLYSSAVQKNYNAIHVRHLKFPVVKF